MNTWWMDLLLAAGMTTVPSLSHPWLTHSPVRRSLVTGPLPNSLCPPPPPAIRRYSFARSLPTPPPIMSFEPHLGMGDQRQRHKHFDDDHGGGGAASLLAELDRIAPIKSFDAFPKVGLERIRRVERI